MNIIVLAGGYSTERDVSLSSGGSICRALRQRGHSAYLLDSFLGLEEIPENPKDIFKVPGGGLEIASDVKATEPDLNALMASRPGDSLSHLGPNVITLCAAADITFIALHGGFGENGKIQAAFDTLGIRYTGPNSLGCALSMDKGITKQLFNTHGVPTPGGVCVTKSQKDVTLEELELRLPVIIKPSAGGSSIGVYIAKTPEEYERAMLQSFRKEEAVVIEPFIDGREYACGIFDGEALPLVEIVPSDGFFDYVNKYQSGGASEICPATSVTPKQTRKIQEAAKRAFETLHLDVYGRADFLVDNKTGEFYCLEVNSLPGMTSASLLPKAAKAAGYEYGEFCEAIINKSMELRYPSAKSQERIMKNMTLETITSICHGTYHGDPALLSRHISGVAIDSRKVEKNFLFVALQGERVNAHKFIPDTMKNGALCAISQEDLGDTDYPYILVPSTAQALLDMAKVYRDSFDVKVVGITGSVGKTSTKEMIASVLAEKYNVHKTQGNLNSDSGLPLTVFQMEEENEVSVLEMGVNHFGEMRKLSTVARPDVCVVTNIGVAHLEFFKTKEGILKEKTEMFQDMNPGGSVIVNGDDPLLAALGPVKGVQPILYGTNEKCTVYATDIEPLGLRGSACVIHTPSGSIACTVPTPGRHMVSNALAGAAVGYVLGLSMEQIKDGIEHLPFIPGRNNIIQTDSIIILDDCYNANPVSMKAAIDVLNNGIGRKVAIIGNMGELGDNEKELHREVGEYLAETGIDVVCAVGDLSKEIVDAIRDTKTNTETYWFDSRDSLIRNLNEIIKEGDNVLVKASNSMRFPEIVKALKAL